MTLRTLIVRMMTTRFLAHMIMIISANSQPTSNQGPGVRKNRRGSGEGVRKSKRLVSRRFWGDEELGKDGELVTLEEPKVEEEEKEEFAEEKEEYAEMVTRE